MTTFPDTVCIAFAGSREIAHGPLTQVAAKVKRHVEKHPEAALLVFDAASSSPVEIDLRGTVDAVVQRLKSASAKAQSRPSGPGRPKLGVVSREVSLLPRHWEWLALQGSGASATLRKLIEDAKKKNSAQDQVRQSQNATYKFMSAMAGDLPLYEEALRAFYAKNRVLFETLIAPWPKDIQEHIRRLSIHAL